VRGPTASSRKPRGWTSWEFRSLVAKQLFRRYRVPEAELGRSSGQRRVGSRRQTSLKS